MRDFQKSNLSSLGCQKISCFLKPWETELVARVNSADAGKDVNKYLPSFLLLSTIAAFHLPGV